jgi:hypothetical protein
MQPMVLVYLPTKLADFVRKMLVNSPAPWSIWDRLAVHFVVGHLFFQV